MEHQPNIYFTQISNLSEARFATSVMAKGIAFCLEHEHPDYISPKELAPFKEWLVGSDWIAALSEEPSSEIKKIIEHFDIQYVLVDQTLYKYVPNGETTVEENKVKQLIPLKSKNEFTLAVQSKTKNVLLFGSKEEEVGMANMDRWLDYFEALEIL